VTVTPEEIIARLLYRDGLMLVLDKPAGFAVHKGPKGGESLEDYFGALRFGLPRAPALAHRLDRDTSGLLIIAKKRSALVELHRMLREGEIEKVYVAAVKGSPARREFEIRESLYKHVNARGERRVSVKEGGLSAFTKVKVLHATEEFSLVELRLMTGRTHQIRVHLAHAGHPVLGDDKYGDFELNRRVAKQGIKRLFLHACRLSLKHPVEKKPIKLESPLPADMQSFVEAQLALPAHRL
jgi:23S rRNA pseudouridine955/2504/2580 synthase